MTDIQVPVHSVVRASAWGTNWNELGITFGRIPWSKRDEVLDFMWANYFPEEPICRSLDYQRTMSWFMDKQFDEHIKGGLSIMATDKDGRMLGVRLAESINKSDQSRRNFEEWFERNLNTFACCFGKINGNMIKVSTKLVSGELQFNVWDYHDQFKVEKILNCGALCSLKDSGIRGIGTELVRQSEAAGIEAGCEMASAIVTGLYSGKIFKKAGYEVQKEVAYAQFKDKNGELYLKDTREHLSCCIMTKRF